MLLLVATSMAQLPDPPRGPNPILQNPPRGPSAWQRIQDPIDRSTGRIVNEPTYQIERLQRRQDETYRRVIPETEFERYQDERERTLRIEQRQMREMKQADLTRREMLDRREMDLYLQGGVTATSIQVQEDARALNQAKGNRDQQLISAQNERAELLRTQPENRQQIEADFQQKTTQIRQSYEQQRERILGIDPPPAPATQPSPTGDTP